MVAVGIAVADLVMMEAALEMVEAMILAVRTVFKFWIHEKRFLEAEALAPVMVEANISPNHETKASVAVPAAAGAMVVAEGFNYCWETA